MSQVELGVVLEPETDLGCQEMVGVRRVFRWAVACLSGGSSTFCRTQCHVVGSGSTCLDFSGTLRVVAILV